MIGKITPAGLGSAADAGGSTRRLIAYLLGPGKRNEHHDPRLVASWGPRPTAAYNARIGAVIAAAESFDWADPAAVVGPVGTSGWRGQHGRFLVAGVG